MRSTFPVKLMQYTHDGHFLFSLTLVLAFILFAPLTGTAYKYPSPVFEQPCSLAVSSPYSIWVGPEVYHFKRQRDGGTSQSGAISSIRVGLDRIKPHGVYIGADYFYAAGRLKGHTGSGTVLRSDLHDHIFEARLGFTYQQNECRKSFFTPFGGWGSFCEINNFTSPSPLQCTFTDTFNYIVIGFLSGVNFQALLSMGIDFKVKFMLDGQSKVTDDPLFEDITLKMENEIQCRLDLPITYNPCNSLFGLAFQLVPFYEFRHFGGREGYPFDFKDTKIYLYGAKFAFSY